jgi:shikimate dehydrogenase
VFARLAVLGDPLAYTRSPDLHRAGLRVLGMDGASAALRTPLADLGARLRELADQGYRGVNLTNPLKQEALAHLDRVAEGARRAASVNTIGFEPDGWWGDTTDGPGFVDWLHTVGRDATEQRVVLLGAGGVARSIALAICEAGGSVTASARKPETVVDAWSAFPDARLVAWASVEEAHALGEATVVVNATPLQGEPPARLDPIPGTALVVDLTYGQEITPCVRAARAAGREAYDGLGMLVFQARRALALWFSRPVPVDPLARAVGWPR